ncbi:MAG: hypothetical protein AAFX78_01850 [Cyanobacteria bacterium J06638_20]
MAERDLKAERSSVCVKVPRLQRDYWASRVGPLAESHYGDVWGNGLSDRWTFWDVAFPAQEKAEAFIQDCEKQGLRTLLEYVGDEKVADSEAFLWD